MRQHSLVTSSGIMLAPKPQPKCWKPEHGALKCRERILHASSHKVGDPFSARIFGAVDFLTFPLV